MMSKICLRRCVSEGGDVKDNAAFFNSTDRGFYKAPYYLGPFKNWLSARNSIFEALNIARFHINKDRRLQNNFMADLCAESGEIWDPQKSVDWEIVKYSSKSEIEVVLKGWESARIRIIPFIDDGRLYAEISRWSGDAWFAYKWIGYVYRCQKKGDLKKLNFLG